MQGLVVGSCNGLGCTCFDPNSSLNAKSQEFRETILMVQQMKLQSTAVRCTEQQDEQPEDMQQQLGVGFVGRRGFFCGGLRLGLKLRGHWTKHVRDEKRTKRSQGRTDHSTESAKVSIFFFRNWTEKWFWDICIEAVSSASPGTRICVNSLPFCARRLAVTRIGSGSADRPSTCCPLSLS